MSCLLYKNVALPKSLIFTLFYNFFVQHPAPDNQIGAWAGPPAARIKSSSVLTHFVPPAK